MDDEGVDESLGRLKDCDDELSEPDELLEREELDGLLAELDEDELLEIDELLELDEELLDPSHWHSAKSIASQKSPGPRA